MTTTTLTTLRAISGVIGVIIAVGAVVVKAPGLAVLALPFLIAAVWLRRGRPVALAALALWSLVYVVIAANFALGNTDQPAIVWSDALSAYVGGPLAAVAAVLAVRGIITRRTAAG